MGSHLCGAFSRRGYEIMSLSRRCRFSYPAIDGNRVERVHLIKGDIENKELLRELVNQVDVIFHNAAIVGTPIQEEDAARFLSTNVNGTANLVEILREKNHRVKKVILGSSISVYGEGNYSCIRCDKVRPHQRSNQFSVDSNWEPQCPVCGCSVYPIPTEEEAARNGQSLYSATKIAQEDLLKTICEDLGISLAVFRYSTVYGPGQSTSNPYANFLRLLLSGKSPLVHEDGNQTRDFIFIDDVVRANLLYLESPLEGVHIFNVGSGQQTTVLEFAQRLSLATSTVLAKSAIAPVVSYSQLEGSVRHCNIDCSRIQKVLGFTAQTELENGVKQLVDWFIGHSLQETKLVEQLSGL